jgi:hypothetical protein
MMKILRIVIFDIDVNVINTWRYLQVRLLLFSIGWNFGIKTVL